MRMSSSSSLSSELISLDDHVKPHSYSMVVKSNNINGDDQQLEDFLARLQQERYKIDAFKRELPLCIHLLSNAMEASRQQLQTYKANQGTPPPLLLEEFIPLKDPISTSHDQVPEKSSNMTADKANWMTSVQLWSQASTDHHHEIKPPSSSSIIILPSPISPKQNDNNSNNNNNNNNNNNSSSSCGSPSPVLRALPELTLSSPAVEERELETKRSCGGGGGHDHQISLAAVSDHHDHDQYQQGKNNNGAGANSSETQRTAISTAATATATASQAATNRKARRCWSPDLHRRFVNALHILGGSQVATPKQIRELMKVEGLTNDEVKSHLQKYRLHTRRPISPSPSQAGGGGGGTHQLVVLGGIWVPPDYTAGAAPATLYQTTTTSSPHYYAPREFYPAHPLPQQLHLYKATPPSSPNSDVMGGGEHPSESIDDGKSESNNNSADNNAGGDHRKPSGTRP